MGNPNKVDLEHMILVFVIVSIVLFCVMIDDQRRIQLQTEEPPTKRRRKEVHPRKPKEFGANAWKESKIGKMILDANCADPLKPEGQLFRQRFRVPHDLFLDLISEVERAPFWKAKNQTDCTRKRPRIPACILVAASLRHLGKGHDFGDSLTWDTRVSVSTLTNFHHDFCAHLASSAIFDRHVRVPQSDEEIKHAQDMYRILGMPGCVGSVDVVHIPWERCPTSERSFFTGKSGFPTIAFNVTVLRGRITHVSDAHPGAMNDKTAVRHDDYIMSVKEGKLYRNIEWEYFQADGSTGKTL
jgi:hypothetical protein